MDALIRHTRLASVRTRLSEVRERQGDAATAQLGAADAEQVRMREIRETIENQVRAELATQMHQMYDTERARAIEEGRETASTMARAAAAEEFGAALKEIQADAASALAAITAAHSHAMSQLEGSVGEVAFVAVCRLLGHRAPSREAVMAFVEQTCNDVRTTATATVHLHPRDIRTLGELAKGGELRVDALGLQVIADESLELGGCIIETASGTYDGALETQLRRLHAVLVEAADASPGNAAAGNVEARPAGRD